MSEADTKEGLKQILSVSNLSKSYGSKTVLKDVTFELREGECLAMIGYNGAGKTTLLKIVLGLAKQQSGEVKFFGKEKLDDNVKQHIGYLPEDITFYNYMTGYEVLKFYTKLKEANVDDIPRLIELVSLTDATNIKVKNYSKGMRQRLGLAQALIGDIKLLFLDEPTTGLDPLGRQILFSIINNLRENGTAIVIISHMLAEIEENVDQLLVLNIDSI
ncbi:MAG: ABC transporter ATP-binding protein [Nitrospinota bacterium]